MHPFVQAIIAVFIGLVVLGPTQPEPIPDVQSTALVSLVAELPEIVETAPLGPIQHTQKREEVAYSQTDAQHAFAFGDLIKSDQMVVVMQPSALSGVQSDDPLVYAAIRQPKVFVETAQITAQVVTLDYRKMFPIPQEKQALLSAHHIPEPEYSSKVINANFVNLREAPNLSARVLTQKSKGYTLKAQNKPDGGWLKVEIEGGVKAWVFGRYVSEAIDSSE